MAAELARTARVTLLEMEPQPGYHTTGRSAAIFAPTYGPAPIRALTRASRDFFENPPDGFCEAPLFSPRSELMIARPDQLGALETLMAEIADSAPVRQIDEAELRQVNPLIRPGYAVAAMLDDTGQDIDVAALHQGYLRSFRAAGGDLRTKSEVIGLRAAPVGWQIETTAGPLEATIVVNAAGAWADVIGQLAGAELIGLVPKRRSAAIIAAPDGINPAPFPITIDMEEQFYLKPEAGKLMISPADETPSPPCDAQPEDLDIAICVDRVETAFDLNVRRIEHKWAGLRSFVADKSPVAGFSGRVDRFYWLAGQGGYGIQSAPALARFAAAQITGQALPEDIAAQGLDAAALCATRPTLVETPIG